MTNLDIFWTPEKVKEQSDAWRDELMPLASTELDQRLISSVTVLMACLGQPQEGMGVNRAAAANAADLAQEVSAHFKTAVTAMTQRLEELERKG